MSEPSAAPTAARDDAASSSAPSPSPKSPTTIMPLDANSTDDDEPIPDNEALPLLVFALENYIDVVLRRLAANGKTASRTRIRNQLFSQKLRYMLIPKPDEDDLAA